ncbi:hypothetical protein UFOVP965_123 [uncultured Caudovirales phage]|uniref:Uncharacterized protein n=1 Tax=uncultured Caudovirales phage TaxID=2100421 RepID=A0A6J5R1Y6_9CAUD|nr:hypothetical protein UFOVP965_123 [uncultured Caudovirales phage]CAB4179912.1 hypothetical protein UFOVP1035_119 [uncultured Caudovirales phage]CAB4188746.1 hypothetical protein UFOVP1181_78 [uncultured Caudovirales phage]
MDASHPNSVQDEIVAIESTIGANPQISTSPSPSGTFAGTSATYADLVARLANIEIGIVSDAHTHYIKKSATSANIITPSGTTIKGLIVKAMAGQSANIAEFQDSSGTANTYIDASGVLVASSMSGFSSLTGTETLTNKTLTAPKINIAFNTQTGTSYTPVLTDNGKMVTLSNASPVAVTVPLNSSVAYPEGAQINFVSLGAGLVTFAGTGGVTVNGTPGLKLRAQYSSAVLIRTASPDVWLLIGDLAV